MGATSFVKVGVGFAAACCAAAGVPNEPITSSANPMTCRRRGRKAKVMCQSPFASELPGGHILARWRLERLWRLAVPWSHNERRHVARFWRDDQAGFGLQ